MAVSPVVVQKGAAHGISTAAKAKALAVRTSTNGASQSATKTGAEPELAEELNEETKQKYVKGGFGRGLPTGAFLIAERQETW